MAYNDTSNRDKSLFIHLLREGNETAWRAMFDRHYVVMCRYAEHFVHDCYSAESIVSDVMLNLWTVRKTLGDDVNLRSYLMRSVYNTYINLTKSKYKKMETTYTDILDLYDTKDTSIIEKAMDNANPFGRLLEMELENEIVAAIERLPEESKKVFLLSRRNGMSYAEIAKELDISINTVKYHIKKALAFLRNELGPYYFLAIFFFLDTDYPQG